MFTPTYCYNTNVGLRITWVRYPSIVMVYAMVPTLTATVAALDANWR
jgi:hypothetical protein